MRRKHLILMLASASPVLSAKLEIANREATIISAKALAAPVGEGALAATHDWIKASSYTTMLHYWHYTGDAQYNDNITVAILGQAGGSKDFGAISPGNDDQLWWGIACITAAEYGVGHLSKPTADDINTNNWFEMATNVFDAVSSRWQEDSCGGIGWQVADPKYRNSITNGLAFQLAARLGRYTGDKKYTDWADKIFDWALKAGLIDKGSYSVYDGYSAPNCDDRNMDKWTYNVGAFLYGSAVMLEHTGNKDWQQHLDGLIGAVKSDFTKDNDNILAELCESNDCDEDQQTFKATLARWLALTSRLVPDTADRIQPILDASAKAALSSCNEQSQCSAKWTAEIFHGTDLGAQMAAVEITGAQLAKDCKLPMKADTNGAGMTSDSASTNGTTAAGTTAGLTTSSMFIAPTVTAAGGVSSTTGTSSTVSTSSTSSTSSSASVSTATTPIANSPPTTTTLLSTSSFAPTETPATTLPSIRSSSSSVPGFTTYVKRTVTKAFTA